ncbi:MAG: 30S ribosomal protein S13 [Candidatus Hydrothermae bacterium]|nr:30S ribosomal protein S13 [Candidatus Hydrothermae bacterium]
MARIAGVDLPRNKRIDVALTYIYGIGWSRSRDIVQRAQVDPSKRVKDLEPEEVTRLRQEVEKYKVEGALRAEVQRSIQRLIEIGCYRGIRHKLGLPVRGQRTRHNARTRKGPRGNMFRRSRKGAAK